MVSAVVVTHNRKNKVIRLLDSLESSSSQDFLEIIVVDDASADGTSEEIGLTFPKVRILHVPHQVFLAKARNMGAHYSKARYILFIDDDVVIDIDSIKRILTFMESHPECGIAGPVVTYFKNRDKIWHAGVCYKPSGINENQYVRNNSPLRNFKRVGFTNCCYLPGIFMVRRKTFDELEGFDSKNFAFSYEDLDLALRTQSIGYKTTCVLSALALHDIDESFIERRMNSMRAFHHGRSRTRFYIRHLKWKIPWLLICFLGFTFMQLSNDDKSYRKRLRVVVSYLKGIVYGIAGR